jgi:hypothetical protein
MKTKNINTRISPAPGSLTAQRSIGGRVNATKSFEHRHERRKIQERLRNLDWALNIED